MECRAALLRSVIGFIGSLMLMLALSSSACAAPVLRVSSSSNTTVAPGDTIDYFVSVANVGDEPTGGALTLVAKLAPGVTVLPDPDPGSTGWDCSTIVSGASTATCVENAIQAPGTLSHASNLAIRASIDGGAAGTLVSSFTVSGGGALTASTVDATRVAAVPPPFGIDSFDAQVNANAAGDPFTQAGGHPYEATTSVLFNTLTNSNSFLGAVWPVEPVKDLVVDLPPGFIADPTATGDARCTSRQLSAGGQDSDTLCPSASQVGTARVFTPGGVTLGPSIPVYNVVAPVGVPARLGFNATGTIVTIDGNVRSGSDYGLRATVHDVAEGIAIAGTTLTLWGVPADPSHDAERSCPGRVPAGGGPSCPSLGPLRPFLRNPTSCTTPGVGLTTTLRADSWLNPGAFSTATTVSHDLPAFPSPTSGWGGAQGPTRCDLVPFTPSLAAQPDLAAAGAPAGFSVDLSLPQSDDPEAVGTSDLRKATVTLPVGVKASAAVADGLAGCSLAQVALKSDDDASCPAASKIGSVSIDTPLLDDPLTGSVYLASPHDNPFNSVLAFYIVARGPGVVVKLPAKVSSDPDTGQLTATLTDQPQLPFSKVHLEFKGGPRAPLANPTTCGIYTTHSVLTSWSGKTVSVDSPFKVDQNCDQAKFAPALNGGVANLTAAASSSFNLRVTRSDTDQEIRQIITRLPKGLLARIGVVPRCPVTTTDCGGASQIGRVTVGAGAGPSPFYINSGRVYLTDGYQGAPFGLLIRVPAVAGPFDLGTVDVRAALSVDPVTAQASVVADPLPRSLEGIPVLAKDIRVSIDRPGFMVNPTSCTPMAIGATVASFEGTSVDLSNRFQVGDCAALGLKPKLSIALTGKGQTTDGKHPAVVAKLTQAAGQANLKKVRVTLPLSLALDSTWEDRNQLCEFVDGSKPLPTCKANSIVGTAKATTPLLKQPLSGPVYFVKNVRKDPKSGRDIRTLPKLVVALTGENGLKLTLTGTSDVVKDRLVTTFDQIPDAPVTAFELDIQGGAKRGVLVVSGADVCKAVQVADRQIDGQNGKTADADITLQTPACPLKILGKTVGKSSVSVKVGGLRAGKVTVSGKGIRETAKTISTATVATITAKRTKARPGKVTVIFDPTGPAKARKTTR